MSLAALMPVVRAFLDERRFAVLATINESSLPHLTAIWYEVQGNEVMMNTARGRLKDRNLRRDPCCALCIEDDQQYVPLYGRATLIDDQAQAQVVGLRLAIRYGGRDQAEERAPLIAQQQRGPSA